MSFPQSVADEVLVKCGRHCCLCGKYAGQKMELHHIKQAANGGEDTVDNCIPLCLDCHAEVASYNPRHPKGRKYTEKELKGHRDRIFQKYGGSFVGDDGSVNTAVPVSHIAESHIQCEQLMEPLTTHYFGRQELLDSIVKWVHDAMSVVCIYGPAGSGKSALIFHLLNSIASKNYCNASVFYWRFHYNDREKETTSNLNAFFDAALKFYGYSKDLRGTDELMQAEILCKLIQECKTIMILDDVQALQSHSYQDNGKVKNKALKMVISKLAREGLANGGLLIMLSTLPVPELGYYEKQGQSINYQLPPLRDENCLDIFRDNHVAGNDAQLVEISNKLEKNPLAITLFARLIRDHCGGDINRKENVNFLAVMKNQNSKEKTALQNVISYCSSIWDSNSNESMLLMLISLFRRPVKFRTMEDLIAQSDFAPQLSRLDASEQKALLSVLRRSGLLIRMSDGDDGLVSKEEYSILPTVREYYFGVFQTQYPAVFEQCNRLMADYVLRDFDDHQVMCIHDMEPLYDAIYYLTNARKYDEALHIMWTRICRYRAFFSQKIFGAFSNDLNAFSMFFDRDRNWEPVQELSDIDRAWICSVVAYLLNTTGSLQESEKLRRKEIEIYEKMNNLLCVASDGRHLARNLTMQAKFGEAKTVFEKALCVVEENLTKKNPVPIGPYAAAMDIEKVRADILQRFAFLYYVQGKPYYKKAMQLIDMVGNYYSISGTSAFFYYLILNANCSSLKEVDALKSELLQYLERARKSQKPHEIAYAYLLCAINMTKYHKLSILPIGMRRFDEIIRNIESALDYSKKISRMDQYPYMILKISGICLDLFRKTANRKCRMILLERINSYFEELEEIFRIYDIPLYEIELGFLRLELHVALGETEQADHMWYKLREQPEVRNYLSDRLREIYTPKYAIQMEGS